MREHGNNMNAHEVRTYLKKFKIKDMQFDLNGVCNAKCWFCPVRYEDMPPRQNMPIKDVEKILDNMIAEKGNIVDPTFRHIYTAHYNEILLYPHYEEFLALLDERNLATMVLTNGVPLTPKMTDILFKYERVISGINFNIPAIEKEEWKKQAGFNSDNLYNRLIENITYLMEKFPNRVANKNISVGMNGVSENSFIEKGGWIERGDHMEVTNTELKRQHKLFQEKFPELYIYMNPSIVDRDGLLEKNNVMSLSKGNEKHNKRGKKVIGCRNGSQSFRKGELTGRPFGWLHVNSLGDAFLCCQDFHVKSTFGNVVENSLEKIWFSDDHVNMISDSFQTVCASCNFAQWG